MPLCWKAFSENTTPHQQHWVAAKIIPSSRNEESSFLLDGNIFASFRARDGMRWRSLTVIVDSPLPPTLLQGHTAWGILSSKSIY